MLSRNKFSRIRILTFVNNEEQERESIHAHCVCVCALKHGLPRETTAGIGYIILFYSLNR